MPIDPPSPGELARATDPDALLPGEDPESTYLEDAVHWTQVYKELLLLKYALLDLAGEMRSTMSEVARTDTEVDQRLLGAQAGRYRTRQKHWLKRLEELGGSANGDELPGEDHGTARRRSSDAAAQMD